MSRPLPVSEPQRALLGAAPPALFDLSIDVVAPLFGGGAVVGVADPQHPIRAASIRGHLRFWWRACKASAYSTAGALFDAESRLWGSTERPSAVSVAVTIERPGAEEACAVFERNDRGEYETVPRWTAGYPGYALFPFQGKRAQNRRALDSAPANALVGVRFRLRIDVTPGAVVDATLKQDVEAALWAWLTFGGIGARTRRGCGSLFCATAPFAPPAQHTTPAITSWLQAMVARYTTPQPRRLPAPALRGARVALGREVVTPRSAWTNAVAILRDYRQAPNVGRNPGQRQNRPGRSRWPEPDSIRRLARTHAPAHRPEQIGDFFPRADLGLPIIFQFKDERAGDPPRSTLQARGDRATRMASPLIVKPLALTADRAVPLVLCLDAPHVWATDAPPLELAIEGTAPIRLAPSHLNAPALAGSAPPLREQGGGATTAREGLLRFASRTLDTPGFEL